MGSVVETRPEFRQQLQRIKARFPYLTLSTKNANYCTFTLPLLLHVSRTQFWCTFDHISLNLTSWEAIVLWIESAQAPLSIVTGIDVP